MNQKTRSLAQVLTKILMQKITRETGYFTLHLSGRMQFQSYDTWLAFQRKYGEISLN